MAIGGWENISTVQTRYYRSGKDNMRRGLGLLRLGEPVARRPGDPSAHTRRACCRILSVIPPTMTRQLFSHPTQPTIRARAALRRPQVTEPQASVQVTVMVEVRPTIQMDFRARVRATYRLLTSVIRSMFAMTTWSYSRPLHQHGPRHLTGAGRVRPGTESDPGPGRAPRLRTVGSSRRREHRGARPECRTHASCRVEVAGRRVHDRVHRVGEGRVDGSVTRCRTRPAPGPKSGSRPSRPTVVPRRGGNSPAVQVGVAERAVLNVAWDSQPAYPSGSRSARAVR